MSHRIRSTRRVAMVAAAVAGLALAAPAAALASPGHYNRAPHNDGPRNLYLNQVNLFTSVPGMPGTQDSGLINPWGLAFTSASGVWVSEQGADDAGAYTFHATTGTGADTPIDVTFPDSKLPVGGPTGQVSNSSSGFVLKDGSPAAFIFDTLDGKIEAWDPADGGIANVGTAESEVTVPGAGFSGLAIASARDGEELFAADFNSGKIDVFNDEFKQITLAPGRFTDPRLNAKVWHAFNVQELAGHIFVTYDTTVPPNPQTGAGPEGLGEGVGAVDEYSTDGRLIERIATGAPLDAPWGLAIAPASWGADGGSLLVGNFGDGKVSIFARQGPDAFAHHAVGQVFDEATGKPFAEPGLWALLPGSSANKNTGDSSTLWFSAGIPATPGGAREHGGLVGVLRP